MEPGCCGVDEKMGHTSVDSTYANVLQTGSSRASSDMLLKAGLCSRTGNFFPMKPWKAMVSVNESQLKWLNMRAYMK